MILCVVRVLAGDEVRVRWDTLITKLISAKDACLLRRCFFGGLEECDDEELRDTRFLGEGAFSLSLNKD